MAGVSKNDRCFVVMAEKIKVVWLCHLSNPMIREHLKVRMNPFEKCLRFLMRKNVCPDLPDFAVWNTNAIHEFEKYDEIELHIVAPYPYLSDKIQEFEHNGIRYHFFRNEYTSLFTLLKKKILRTSNLYLTNRKRILQLINQIKPDIIHLIGAENPYYSLAFLDFPYTTPTIVQLQTLLSDSQFKDNYPIREEEYDFRSRIEREIIQKADYIGTIVEKFINIIKKQIKPSANILELKLAVGEEVNLEECPKQYDFVYFALDISKTGDLALEAFGLAYSQNPKITLDVVGGFSSEFRKELDTIINQYNMESAVTFEGLLPTHEDVLKQIRKSRYALLPLKIDITSGTIREAMANGLPVLTTDTGEHGTQLLNKNRRSVLISSSDAPEQLANNMLLLLKDKELANELRENGYLTLQEKHNNQAAMAKWVEAYKKIYSTICN